MAVANSSRYALDPSGIVLTSLDTFKKHSKAGDLAQLVEALDELSLDNVVVLDLTASKDVANFYLHFAGLGWHLVSANKPPVNLA